MGGLLPETLLTTWQLLFSALWSTKSQGHHAPSTPRLSHWSQRESLGLWKSYVPGEHDWMCIKQGRPCRRLSDTG